MGNGKVIGIRCKALVQCQGSRDMEKGMGRLGNRHDNYEAQTLGMGIVGVLKETPILLTTMYFPLQ